MPDRYLPGVPCWIELLAPDPAGAESFYADLFGWAFDGGVARLGGRAVARHPSGIRRRMDDRGPRG